MMTKAEYKELLINKSLAGSFPAMNDKGICKYRTQDGKCCVIGWLIPDDVYTYNFENETCRSLATLNLFDATQYADLSLNNFNELQLYHDIQATWDHEHFVEFLNDLIPT